MATAVVTDTGERENYLNAGHGPKSWLLTVDHKRIALFLLPLLIALSAVASASAVTVSPLPGTPEAMPQTQISFLGAARGSLSAVTVVGSRSGRHGGRLRSYSSAAGASFVPSRPFLADEHVTVHARWRTGRHTVTLTTHFKVAQPVAPPTAEFPTAPGTAADVQSFATGGADMLLFDGREV